jgi:anti-anti-sigma regulatory factor
MTVREVVRVLTPEGDVLNEESLQAAVRILDDASALAVHLDMGAVRLPTAEGVGLLVTLNKELRARGGRLALINVQPDPYGAFEVMGLIEVLDVRAVFRNSPRR